jgi:RNA polymerase sigma factor (sigma-70 family)
MSEVTRILSAIEQGDPQAAEQLLPLVYDELRKLAAQKLAQEKPGQTLQATALVHEAYLRLVASSGGETSPGPTASPGRESGEPHWNSRGHFFGAAAEAMRRILIDNARRKQADKHGGGLRRVDLDRADGIAEAPPADLLAFNEALEKLSAHDAIAGQIVKLRSFAGLSVEQAAEALGLSRAGAYRSWTFARAWLRCQLTGGSAAGER